MQQELKELFNYLESNNYPTLTELQVSFLKSLGLILVGSASLEMHCSQYVLAHLNNVLKLDLNIDWELFVSIVSQSVDNGEIPFYFNLPDTYSAPQIALYFSDCGVLEETNHPYYYFTHMGMVVRIPGQDKPVVLSKMDHCPLFIHDAQNDAIMRFYSNKGVSRYGGVLYVNVEDVVRCIKTNI